MIWLILWLMAISFAGGGFCFFVIGRQVGKDEMRGQVNRQAQRFGAPR
jgi:uncharacterized membrane protein YdjX (TVP38/TMEM64 family)